MVNTLMDLTWNLVNLAGMTLNQLEGKVLILDSQLAV